MKKKLVSMLALSLCLCMGVSTLAGCNPDDSSSSSDSTPPAPLTQDEIYAKVVEAMDATVSYTGAYTLAVTETSEGTEVRPDNDEEGKSSSQTTRKVGVDPAGKKLFMTESESSVGDDDGRVRSQTGKVFKEGDKYYSYSKQSDTYDDPVEQETYVEIYEAMVGVSMANYSLKNFDYSEFMPSDTITIADYNAAWASYIADSKAELVAGTADEDSDWYGYSGDGSYVVSAAEVDGGYALTVEMSYSLTDEEDYTESFSYKYVFTAKDGKLVSTLMQEEYYDSWYEADDGEGNWEEVTKDTAGAQLATDREVYEALTTISYEFDQAGYDAITTTLPADVQVQPDRISKYINVVVNGVDYGEEFVWGNTVAQALHNAWSQSNVDVVWYTDAACTQAIDTDTMTMAQLLAIDAIYGKATAQEGYLLYTIYTECTSASDVTDAYKIVLKAYFEDNVKEIGVCSVDTGITLFTNDDRKQIFVNGVKVENGDNAIMDYPVEAGQNYEVKEVFEVSKAECNFFDVMY